MVRLNNKQTNSFLGDFLAGQVSVKNKFETHPYWMQQIRPIFDNAKANSGEFIDAF